MRSPWDSTSVARGSLTTEHWRMPTSLACVSRKALRSGARGGSVWRPEVGLSSLTVLPGFPPEPMVLDPFVPEYPGMGLSRSSSIVPSVLAAALQGGGQGPINMRKPVETRQWTAL